MATLTTLEQSSNVHPDAGEGPSNRRATSTAYDRSAQAQTATARIPSASFPTIDIETPLPPYSHDDDPYALSAKLKPDSELDLIRAQNTRKRDGCGPIKLNSRASKARKLQDFYENQNENIQRWLKPVDEHVRSAKETEGANHLKYQIASKGSFVANVVLSILQVYGAISNGGSLSLFTTMADSIFDPLSNILLMVSHHAVKRVDPRRFPSGKARLETVGNIIFCCLMTSVSIIIIVLSLLELKSPPKNEVKHFNIPSIVAVGIATVTKLALFAYCWALRNMYSQIRILWEDHR